MTRRLAFALAAMVLLGPPSAGAADNRASTLRVVFDQDINVVDPIATTAYATRALAYLVFDTLVSMDSKGQYKPQMLDSWKISDNGRTYFFKLRSGLEWHDGTSVTAADCVASLKRWGARDGLGRQLLAATKEIRPEGPLDFVLELSKPFGLVIEAIGKSGSNVPVMMPARLAATDPTKSIEEVIGSGPFRFDKSKWRPGDKMVFPKNVKYVPRSEPADGFAGGKVVNFDAVEIVSIPDSSTKISALVNGEIDFIQTTPPDFIEQLRGNKSVTIPPLTGLGQTLGGIRLNHVQPPFDNPLVRKAVQLLVDEKEFMGATGLPSDLYDADCYAQFMCDGPYASNAGTEPLRKASIEAARAVLKTSGYKNEPVVVFQAADTPTINAIALVIIERMKQIGFNVQVRTTDWSTLSQQRWNKEGVDKGGWSVMPAIYSGHDMASPLTHYGTAYNCNGGYPGWSCDEQMTGLLAKFIAESDLDRRKKIADEIQVRAHETQSLILVGQFSNPPAFRSELKGGVTTGIPLFWNIKRGG